MALSTSVTVSASPLIYHGCLGHLSLKIKKYLVQSGSVSFPSSIPPNFMCQSCLCNKSQHLPFGESTLESHGPLDLIYTDVWGPSPVQSVNGFYYYVIFADHFTKYVWLYTLRLKSNDVFTIFRQYKAVVEKFFKHPIICLLGWWLRIYYSKRFPKHNGYSTSQNTTSHTPTQWHC